MKSSNGGTSFGSATSVTDGSATLAFEPAIAVYPDPSDDIHVAWEDHRNVQSNNNFDVYYAKSTNGGTSFSTNINVISGDLNNRGQGNASIGVDELGNPHVVWNDYRNDMDGWWFSGGGVDFKNDADIYYAESTNGGTSFGTNMRVNDDTPVSGYDKEQSHPAVAVTGGIATSDMVHIVWMDERNVASANFDIYYSRYIPDPDVYYRDGSWGWGTELEISTDSGTENQNGYGFGYSIAVNGNKVHVVYDDQGDGDYDIYYRYYDGSSWQTEVEISTDSGTETQLWSSIAVDGTNVHVVWQDKGDGDWDIYYRHYDGSSWQTEVEISTDSGSETQEYAAVAVDGSEVHVVWQDKGDGDYDLYYRYYDGSSWQTEQEISTDSGTEDQGYPSIAVESGKVHAVWDDKGDGDCDVYYRYYDGSSWQTEQEISTDSGSEGQGFPSIAVESGKIHVVWYDYGDGDSDIYYRYFDGSSWQTEVEISTDSGTETQHSAVVALDGDRVHVTWSDAGGGDWDIVYKYYDGSSWQTEEEVSTDSGTEDQYESSIAVDCNVVHIVWDDKGDGDWDIYYRSTVRSWQTEQQISTDTTTEWQFHPSIAVNGDKVHVVWADWEDGDPDIKYRYYDGSTWQTEVELSTDTGTEWQVQPDIAVDGTKVYVVWADKGDGDYDIYYRHYTGSTWQSEVQISTDSGTEWQCQPTIAVDSAKPHVAWIDKGGGDWDIYYTYHNGVAWQTEQQISTDSGTEWQMEPDIALDGTKVHIVWDDYGGGDWDIYYRYYTGSSWQTEVQISTDSGTEDQGRPSIAVNSGKVHVTWDDYGGGDWDIYYRYYDGSSWQTEQEVSSDSGTEDQWDPDVAVDGADVYVLWVDTSDGDPDVYWRYYDGNSWKTEQEISSDSGTEEQYSPAIAVDDGKAHAVWEDWQS
ncbi:MAG: hypothetical protein ACW99J_18320 [Candidatus Thorarchaeota archaeon]